MARLRPSGGGSDPLNVLAMALALVVAAMVGAGLGFALDFFTGASGQAQADTSLR
jgi:hypothetical protein